MSIPVGEVTIPNIGNGRVYVSWHHFLTITAGGITVILGGIFVIFSYVMHIHEKNPHNGSARFAEIERIETRIETRLDHMDEKSDIFREATLQKLDVLRESILTHHTRK